MRLTCLQLACRLLNAGKTGRKHGNNAFSPQKLTCL
nr:MAG TPA: hypothetical protein [Caudoviricetes sp.]DAK79125.1 MAG TPA: hypothetical protein [Caudoviricetes sp.]